MNTNPSDPVEPINAGTLDDWIKTKPVRWEVNRIPIRRKWDKISAENETGTCWKKYRREKKPHQFRKNRMRSIGSQKMKPRSTRNEWMRFSKSAKTMRLSTILRTVNEPSSIGPTNQCRAKEREREKKQLMTSKKGGNNCFTNWQQLGRTRLINFEKKTVRTKSKPVKTKDSSS